MASPHDFLQCAIQWVQLHREPDMASIMGAARRPKKRAKKMSTNSRWTFFCPLFGPPGGSQNVGRRLEPTLRSDRVAATASAPTMLSRHVLHMSCGSLRSQIMQLEAHDSPAHSRPSSASIPTGAHMLLDAISKGDFAMQHTPTWPLDITWSRLATLNVLAPVRRPGRGAPERLRGVAGYWGRRIGNGPGRSTQDADAGHREVEPLASSTEGPGRRRPR